MLRMQVHDEKSSMEFARLRISSIFFLSSLRFYVLSNYTSSGISLRLERFCSLCFVFETRDVPPTTIHHLAVHAALYAYFFCCFCLCPENFLRKNVLKFARTFRLWQTTCDVDSDGAATAMTAWPILAMEKHFARSHHTRKCECLFPTNFHFEPTENIFVYFGPVFFFHLPSAFEVNAPNLCVIDEHIFFFLLFQYACEYAAE